MLNKVQLIGFTGADAEIRTTSRAARRSPPCGSPPTATPRRTASGRTTRPGTRSRSGTRARSAGSAAKGLPKGSKVFVEGEIRHDRYTDKDGQERFFSKVVVATPQHELKSLDRQEAADED